LTVEVLDLFGEIVDVRAELGHAAFELGSFGTHRVELGAVRPEAGLGGGLLCADGNGKEEN
jgi:hypothetical protein